MKYVTSIMAQKMSGTSFDKALQGSFPFDRWRAYVVFRRGVIYYIDIWRDDEKAGRIVNEGNKSWRLEFRGWPSSFTDFGHAVKVLEDMIHNYEKI